MCVGQWGEWLMTLVHLKVNAALPKAPKPAA
jgi:hypothetical protein